MAAAAARLLIAPGVDDPLRDDMPQVFPVALRRTRNTRGSRLSFSALGNARGQADATVDRHTR